MDETFDTLWHSLEETELSVSSECRWSYCFLIRKYIFTSRYIVGADLGLKLWLSSRLLISSLSKDVKVYSLTNFLLRDDVQAFLGRPPGPAGDISLCLL